MATTVLPLLKVGGMQLFKTDSSGTEKILPKTNWLSLFDKPLCVSFQGKDIEKRSIKIVF
jgi:hypothetical protein